MNPDSILAFLKGEALDVVKQHLGNVRKLLKVKKTEAIKEAASREIEEIQVRKNSKHSTDQLGKRKRTKTEENNHEDANEDLVKRPKQTVNSATNKSGTAAVWKSSSTQSPAALVQPSAGIAFVDDNNSKKRASLMPFPSSSASRSVAAACETIRPSACSTIATQTLMDLVAPVLYTQSKMGSGQQQFLRR